MGLHLFKLCAAAVIKVSLQVEKVSLYLTPPNFTSSFPRIICWFSQSFFPHMIPQVKMSQYKKNKALIYNNCTSSCHHLCTQVHQDCWGWEWRDVCTAGCSHMMFLCWHEGHKMKKKPKKKTDTVSIIGVHWDVGIKKRLFPQAFGLGQWNVCF